MVNKNYHAKQKKNNFITVMMIAFCIALYFLFTRILINRFFILLFRNPIIVSEKYIDAFGLPLISSVAFIAIGKSTALSRKQIIIMISIVLLLLLIAIFLSGNAIVISDDTISKTVFYSTTKNYSFKDISSTELYISSVGLRGRHITFCYTIYFTDGNSIVFNIGEGYLKSENDLIMFDQRIDSFRSFIGNYKYVSSFSENINSYYKNIWHGVSAGTGTALNTVRVSGDG